MKKYNRTRLHSSRMRTARMLTISPSMLCARRCAWSWGCFGLEGGCLVWGGCLAWGGGGGGIPACTEAEPPVNRMTNRCKNITLPQTSFAGGSNCSSGTFRVEAW